MNIQLTTSGRRKGKQNAWRRMLSSVADKTLHIFPVPGLDVFLAKGFNPHQKGIAIAATPRHANVLLVTSPLPEKLVKYAANVYAQMPRPRLLVFVATNHVAPLPPPDFVLSADELNHLHQRIIFPDAWSGDALPYELPSTEDEGKSMYTCPMHPEVQSDKPGKCPKCAMFLVRQEPEEQSMNISADGNDKHQHHEHMHKGSADEGKTIYTCPMHPEVQSDKPGDCPKCGMTLVKQENKEHQMNLSEGKALYSCPMHPEVQSDKPGKCPKCGMFLVRQEPEKQSMNMSTNESDKHQHHEHMHKDSADEGKALYSCPMHPEVQSDKPGDCPKCGMTLVKQENKEHQMDMSEDKGLYTCPMHPEVQSDKPGECPKCGMTLVKQEDKEHQMDMSEDKTIYTCPMHPEVQSDKPGDCPKCGMTLVKQEDKEQQMNMFEGKTIYTCPMHPEVQSDKPGDCPKCGMTLVKQENKEQQVNMSEDKPVYTCPMHPEVQSDKPGKCPKCGMFLVKQDHDEQSMNMSTDESDKHQHHEHMQDNSVTEDKTIYTCPMHPEVQSDKPGDCPKCGMTLVKQESKEHQIDMSGGHQHEMKGHEGMGFMSMVQMTKDMPRSEDGLAMEMNDAFFGPFHLGLPGGLLVKMKLDGDSVVTANCKKGILSQHLLRHFPKEPEKLAKYLSQLNPLLHETYSLLLSKAFANATGRNDFADEVSVLEKDRIASHLNWLSVFSMTIGTRQLHYEASKLCYELQSQQAEKRNILKLTTKIKKTLYLKKRLSNIGIIPDDFIKQVSGPLARAAGMEQDVRSSQPAYQQRNFKPVVVQQNNAWGQLLVRLAEIEQSLELIDDETLHKESSVPEIRVNYNHNGEQNGEAALEAPNGRLHLKIQLKGGQVTNLSLQTASMAHAALVPEVTKGKELADALASIAALDISPWEMDV